MSDQASNDAARWRALTQEQSDAISRHLAVAKPSSAPMIAPISTSTRKPKSKFTRDVQFVLLVSGGVLGALILIGLLNMRPPASVTPMSSGSAQATPSAPRPPAASQPTLSTDTSTTTTTTSSDPDVRADGGLDYLTMKAEAEEQLKAKLTDDHGLRYREVHTRLSTLKGGGIVAFCGQVNSRTPLGGYGGFERFLASRSVAVTESSMSSDDFAQAWSRFCTDGVEGPRVWF